MPNLQCVAVTIVYVYKVKVFELARNHQETYHSFLKKHARFAE